MKSSLHVATVRPGEARVVVPDGLLSALSIRSGDQLYAFLREGPGSDRDRLGPSATLYATPLPHRAWGRLVTASFTSGPGPATLAALTACLQELRMHGRFIESGETRPLNTDDYQDPLESSGPDTTCVLEIPREATLDPNDPADAMLIALTSALRSQQLVTADCVGKFRTAVASAASKLRIARVPRVESVAPLRTVNHLATLLSHHNSAFRKTDLEATTTKKGQQAVCIRCDPWRHILWPETRNVVEAATDPRGTPLAVIMSIDSIEHLLTLQFYRLDYSLLAAFEVAVPAAGLEHRWWRWVYDEIAASHGSILGSRSTGRLQGKWGSLSLVAVLPGYRGEPDGAEPSKSDISFGVECFKALKGISDSKTASESRNNLLRDLRGTAGFRHRATLDCLSDKDASAQLTRDPRLDSTLSNVRLWYNPHHSVDAGYEGRFGLNPFSFTKPLYLGQYKKLYGQTPHESQSRFSLASRLQECLTATTSENVVLVGAYRSGKTSVMNLVVDLINQPSVAQVIGAKENSVTSPVIAIRINAAVTPPELLFVAVFNEICKTRESSYADELRHGVAGFISRVTNELVDDFSQFLRLEPALEVEFALPFVNRLKLSLRSKGDKKHHEDIQELVESETRLMSGEPVATRAGRLRASILMLRALLRRAGQRFAENRLDDSKLKKVLTRSEFAAVRRASGPFRVVVALDEVTDSATWGSEWAFPAWRQLIEDPFARRVGCFRPLAHSRQQPSTLLLRTRCESTT